MRKASSNWLGKTVMAVVMGVLIVSFGIWGIADIFRNYGQGSLAKVGSTEISAEQFRQTYTERLQAIGKLGVAHSEYVRSGIGGSRTRV